MKAKGNFSELMVKFYCDLPEEMTNSALDEIAKMGTNRKWKREFKSIKNREEKMVFALKSKELLAYFIDSVYEHNKDKIPFALDSIDYQEIVDSYDEENYMLNTIFIFKKFKEDFPFRAGILNSFLRSKLFHTIVFSSNPKEKIRELLAEKSITQQEESEKNTEELLQENSVQEPEKITEELLQEDSVQEPEEITEELLQEDSVQEPEIMTKELLSQNPMKKINLKPEDKLMKFYGKIDIRNDYYNFSPQYMEKNAEIIELHAEELKKMFPSHGSFNLKGSWGVTNDFLKKLNIYSADSLEQSFYIIELKESDLRENTDENYQKKIDLAEIVESGRRVQNMIRPIQDACFYRAVTPVLAIDNDSFSDLIEINEEECPEGESVVLLFDNKLYGIFKVSKKYSDKKCIRPEATLKNYLLDYCDANACKHLEFDIQLYGQNPIPVNFYKFVPNGKKQDVIPDSVLLEKLKDNIRPELALENPEEFVRICSNSPFLGKLQLPEDVRKNRIARVKELITRVAIHKNDIVSLTEELLNQIGQQLPEHLIESSEIYQKQAEKLRVLYESQEDLQANLENLTAELKKYETSFQATCTASNEEVEALKAELANFRKQKALYEDIEKLKAEKAELRVQNKFLNEEQFQLREESKKLKKEVQDAIANGFEHRADKAFDSYISHAMLEAAAQWEKTDETDKLKEFINKVADQKSSELSGENLISELVNRIQAKRNYTPNDILNIYISIVQNFITVFSGEPGVGKTSICNIIADSLGMNSFENDNQDSCLNRYIPVSVERGWQSKRDLIGYFNPLTRKYDRSNSKVYDALRILDTERENSKYPLFILLDEANLSPLEYYWADFMRLADKSELNSRFINIGTDSDIFIPDTLRFLATINTDQTTEQLSPRFIDRACIIKLPNVAPKETHSINSENVSPIPWKNLVEIFDTPKDDKASPLLTVRERIYELFNQHNICVSPRIELNITRYIQVAQGIMESENGVRNHEKALDYVVLQKLLPKINGNYELYRSLFEKLKAISTENHLFMTLKAIETMEKFQEENMGYCQYLI